MKSSLHFRKIKDLIIKTKFNQQEFEQMKIKLEENGADTILSSLCQEYNLDNQEILDFFQKEEWEQFPGLEFQWNKCDIEEFQMHLERYLSIKAFEEEQPEEDFQTFYQKFNSPDEDQDSLRESIKSQQQSTQEQREKQRKSIVKVQTGSLNSSFEKKQQSVKAQKKPIERKKTLESQKLRKKLKTEEQKAEELETEKQKHMQEIEEKIQQRENNIETIFYKYDKKLKAEISLLEIPQFLYDLDLAYEQVENVDIQAINDYVVDLIKEKYDKDFQKPVKIDPSAEVKDEATETKENLNQSKISQSSGTEQLILIPKKFIKNKFKLPQAKQTYQEYQIYSKVKSFKDQQQQQELQLLDQIKKFEIQEKEEEERKRKQQQELELKKKRLKELEEQKREEENQKLLELERKKQYQLELQNKALEKDQNIEKNFRQQLVQSIEEYQKILNDCNNNSTLKQNIQAVVDAMKKQLVSYDQEQEQFQLQIQNLNNQNQNALRTKQMKGLQEIFVFYCKLQLLIGTNPTFEIYEEASTTLNLAKYSKFLKDFKVMGASKKMKMKELTQIRLLTREEVQNVYLKFCNHIKLMNFNQFEQSLQSISYIFFNETYDQIYNLPEQEKYSKKSSEEKYALLLIKLNVHNPNIFRKQMKTMGQPFQSDHRIARIPENDMSKKYKFKPYQGQKYQIEEWKKQKEEAIKQQEFEKQIKELKEKQQIYLKANKYLNTGIEDPQLNQNNIVQNYVQKINVKNSLQLDTKKPYGKPGQTLITFDYLQQTSYEQIKDANDLNIEELIGNEESSDEDENKNNQKNIQQENTMGIAQTNQVNGSTFVTQQEVVPPNNQWIQNVDQQLQQFEKSPFQYSKTPMNKPPLHSNQQNKNQLQIQGQSNQNEQGSPKFNSKRIIQSKTPRQTSLPPTYKSADLNPKSANRPSLTNKSNQLKSMADLQNINSIRDAQLNLSTSFTKSNSNLKNLSSSRNPQSQFQQKSAQPNSQNEIGKKIKERAQQVQQDTWQKEQQSMNSILQKQQAMLQKGMNVVNKTQQKL